jgi:ABC-type lipoprotein release transport system permease subunit
VKAFRLALVGLRGAADRPLLYIMPLLLSAAATAILAMFLSLAAGIGQAFDSQAPPAEVIVLPKGVSVEGQGSLSLAKVKTIESAPMLAHPPDASTPVASAEVLYGHGFHRPNGKGYFHMLVRGLDSPAVAKTFRQGFQLTAGRMFRAGANELIVGTAAQTMNPRFRPGEAVKIDATTWHIVGVFHTTRQADNLQFLGSAADLNAGFDKGNIYKSVRVRLQKPDDLRGFRSYLAAFPDLNVHAERLAAYQANAGRTMRHLVIFMGVIVEILLLLAACLGAFYALRALIQARIREIGLLRSLGFQRSSVFGALLIEALVVTLLGSLIAIALVAGTFTGREFYSVNIGGAGSFLFQPRLTPAVVGAAALAALLLGFIGGAGPAWRAGRLAVASVLQQR